MVKLLMSNTKRLFILVFGFRFLYDFYFVQVSADVVVSTTYARWSMQTTSDIKHKQILLRVEKEFSSKVTAYAFTLLIW